MEIVGSQRVPPATGLSLARRQTVKLLHAQTGEFAESFLSSGGRVSCVAINANDEFAVAGTEKGTLALLRLTDKKARMFSSASTNNVTSVAFSCDGRMLATASRDRTIRLWRVGSETLEPLLTLRTSFGPVAVVRFDPTASKLVSLTLNETAVHVWDLDALRHRFKEMEPDWRCG